MPGAASRGTGRGGSGAGTGSRQQAAGSRQQAAGSGIKSELMKYVRYIYALAGGAQPGPGSSELLPHSAPGGAGSGCGVLVRGAIGGVT